MSKQVCRESKSSKLDNIRLIREIGKRPGVVVAKKFRKREKLWKEISEKLGDEVVVLKDRWENLKRSYASARKKQKSGKQYSQYYLYEEMAKVMKLKHANTPSAIDEEEANLSDMSDIQYEEVQVLDTEELATAAVEYQDVQVFNTEELLPHTKHSKLDNIRLIREIQKRPGILVAKKFKKRMKLWKEISEKLGDEVALLKDRWANLKRSYASARKRHKSGKQYRQYYLYEEMTKLMKLQYANKPSAIDEEETNLSDADMSDIQYEEVEVLELLPDSEDHLLLEYQDGQVSNAEECQDGQKMTKEEADHQRKMFDLNVLPYMRNWSKVKIFEYWKRSMEIAEEIDGKR